MNRRLERVLKIGNRNRAACSPEQRIRAYLDSLCGPLKDLLPFDQCQQIRAETESHLDALVAELRAEGLSAEAATQAALRAYGDPQALGRAIARTWNSGRSLHRRNVARMAAFLCVSLVMFESGAFLELYTFDPAGSATPLGLLLIGLCLLAVLTGSVTAILIPFRSAAAVVKMTSVWLLYAFLGGFAMLPRQSGNGTALFLLCVSLPISMLVAGQISALLARHAPASMQSLSSR